MFELSAGGFTVFEFSELAAASNNFSYILGKGGYGCVYKVVYLLEISCYNY